MGNRMHADRNINATLNTMLNHYVENNATDLLPENKWRMSDYANASALLSEPTQQFNKKHAFKSALKNALVGAGIGGGVGLGVGNATKNPKLALRGLSIGALAGATRGAASSAMKSSKEKRVLDDYNERRKRLPVLSKDDSEKIWRLTESIWDAADKRDAVANDWNKGERSFDTQERLRALDESNKELRKHENRWNDFLVSKINEKTASEELDSMYKQALMGGVGDSVMLGTTINDLTKKYNKAAGGMTGMARQKAGWNAVAGGIGKSVAKGAILGAGAQVAASAVDNITKPTQEDEYGRRVVASEVLDEMYKDVISYE